MRDVVAQNQTNARDCLRAAPDEAVNPVPNGEKGELENSNTNGFLRTLRGYAVIGGFPVSLMDVEQEFSPIDAVASAVLRLGRAPARFSVFHACNNHWVQMGDVIFALRKYGFGIRVVDEDYFDRMLAAYSDAHEDSDAVSGLIAYNTHNTQSSCYLGYENAFTTKALYRLGWKWPITDDAYLTNTIRKLDELGFFDEEQPRTGTRQLASPTRPKGLPA